MIIGLEELKTFARIDYDDDDVLLLPTLIAVAEEGLKNATGIVFTSENSLAKLYCLVVAKDLYDIRELNAEKVSEKARFTIQNILIQLKYCYPPEVVV